MQKPAVRPNEQQLQERARIALASVVNCDPSQVDQFFVTRANRPIFPEHTTRGPDGSVQRYDRAALAAIVDRCNRRILDTGDLAAMSAGHTPTPAQQATGMPMPDLVGFTGPFRLGQIGSTTPRWCIFADEHIFKDDYSRVLKMPRRSPEVWLEPRMEDRILDPVAVLGAETPRLDTGIGRDRFSRGRLDPARYTNVARYSMSMGAMPSGSNTFTQKYGTGSDGGSAMLDEQTQSIVEAVLQGIAATPQWAWLTEQMSGSQNPMPTDADAGPTPSPDAVSGAQVNDPSNPTGNPADPTAAGAPGAQPDAGGTNPVTAPSSDPNAVGEGAGDGSGAAPTADTAPTDNTAPGATPEEMASMGDDEKQEYSRLSPNHQAGYMMARRRHCKSGGTMQYANPVDKARYSRMESELNNLRGENAALRSERTFRDRYSKLAELNQIHDFDLEEESRECSGMKDDQFTKHLERISTRYSRRDPNGGMPMLELPPLDQPKAADEAKRERYSRRAVELATKAMGNGKALSADEAFALAKAEIDKAG
jgi:hypothetical protein